ncbi:2-amino-3-ketobutyrate coenzyme a ligase [Anaeramoeba flamelloides]|uniref:2-amino-3-ketobutyrate coenzyme A ligase, mitochondrial n=1 Tax=Anaeramoeba flamelloides TaxID=1746091 RepID=A0AAV7Z2X7_9EUKA|nr:2-amino-3-ketobutyrate coenzyme a ligase [Anaeramoeba flamelloides]KAJ6241649.1 2-amino-3-ketobutyrate coenzyme a ligase [Anaeramoeba flamelloides]
MLSNFLRKQQYNYVRNTFAKSAEGIVKKQLQEIRKAGTWKAERIINTQQSASIGVEGTQNKVLNFCANNYLGLSNSPDLMEAAKDVIDSHGLGLSSVRFICGTQDIHKKLESMIAQFHRMDDTILYSSCFTANGGLFEGFVDPVKSKVAILSDSLNHASIIDGIRLNKKARRMRYNHIDMQDLENKLIEAQDQDIRIITTDGVFSMDGDVAPLKKICDLADRYDSIVMVDESHATGFFGKTGRGASEFCNVLDRVDLINSTLGKALGGSSGGFTTGKQCYIDMLRQRSRPYLFSNTLAPAVVGASIKVFDILLKSTELRDKLERNTLYFRDKMTKAGFDILAGEHPIIPIMLYEGRLANEFADEMLKRGIYVIGFSYPVVPKGEARIRVQISAGHSKQQLDKAIDAFIEVGISTTTITRLEPNGSKKYLRFLENSTNFYFPVSSSGDEATISLYSDTCLFDLYFTTGMDYPTESDDDKLKLSKTQKSNACLSTISLEKKETKNNAQIGQLLYVTSKTDNTTNRLAIKVTVQQTTNIEKTTASLVISVILLAICCLITMIIIVFLSRKGNTDRKR